MHKPTALLLPLVVLAAGCARTDAPLSVKKAGVRVVELTETVKLEPHGKDLRIWLPVPRTTPVQTVEILGVESPIPYRETTDKEFGNKILYFEKERPGPITIKTRYRITRRERRSGEASQGDSLTESERELYLKPRGLVVIDDEVKKIAAASVGDEEDAFAAGRKLYDTVLSRMAYDKNVPGWGKGDTLRACEVGKGHCTDCHSLFMSLVRSRGIPARFHMGLPFKKDVYQELGRKYHCWAEFFVSGKGWVPVDISEAWKAKEKIDYFFGNLDENRVTLTVGREIRLEPPQAGRLLNYFAYPYVEVDGKPRPLYELKREVRTIKQQA